MPLFLLRAVECSGVRATLLLDTRISLALCTTRYAIQPNTATDVRSVCDQTAKKWYCDVHLVYILPVE